MGYRQRTVAVAVPRGGRAQKGRLVYAFMHLFAPTQAAVMRSVSLATVEAALPLVNMLDPCELVAGGLIENNFEV
jgi:hypothetical protein